MKTLNIGKLKTAGLAVAFAAAAVLSARAANVTFTGKATEAFYTGETQPWRNLSNPANYDGGVLPTADDVLVYDVSTLSGELRQMPYLSASLAVKGLVAKNYSGALDLSAVGDEAVLTIGSEGISCVSLGAFYQKCAVATAADQTWKADSSARFEIHNKIRAAGGTSLTFGTGVKAGPVGFIVPPEYDGTMIFANANFVSYRRNGKWANAIKFSGNVSANDQIILFEPYEDLEWETIFPEKRDYTWANDYIRQFVVGYSTLQWPRGDNDTPPYNYVGKYKLRISASSYKSVMPGLSVPASGVLELTGTAAWETSNVYAYVGYGTPDYGYPNRRDGFAKLLLDGSATLGSHFVNVGYYGRWSEGSERVLDQRGGTVKAQYGVNVGGNWSDRTDVEKYPDSNPAPWNEYVLGGGVLNASAVRPSNWASLPTTAVNAGLGICSQDQKTRASTAALAKPTSAGVFTMTGGVANVGGVRFGAYRAGWWASAGQAPYGIGDGFGMFDLRGGTVNLGADGFYLGTGWNAADAGESNSVYRVSLGGGVLKTTTAQTNALAVCFPPTGTPAEINAAKDFCQLGPVHGSGTLRKTGAGTLTLADASRFTGALEVNEGVVAVDYAPTAADAESVGTDFVCWRADSLSALDDGADVTSWPSTDASVTAGACTSLSSVMSPRYRAGAFNGHGGVEFYTNLVDAVWQGCTLEIPGASNPLVGSEDHTIVVVYRPDNFDASSTDIGEGDPYKTELPENQVYYSQGIVGNLDQSIRSAVGLSILTNGYPTLFEGFHDPTTLYCGIGYRMAGRKNVSEKGKVSVAIGTLAGAKMTLDVDGEEWTKEYDEIRESMDAGTTYKRFYAADQKKANAKPFYFGNSGAGYQSVRSAFKGQIAEVRIYPTRALDAAERKSLALALLARYDETAAARRPAQMANGSFPGAFASAAAPALPVGASALDAAALAAAGTVAAGTPATVADAINGRSVLRFGGADALTLAANATPVAGQTAFTAAVVFRTTAEGSGENGYAIGSGLVSTWQGGASDPDYAISFRRFGTVGAGTGNSTGAQFCNDFKPARLDDGLPHVAVFAVDPTAKKMHVMTDGRLTTRAFFAATTTFDARGSYATTIGALNTASGDKAGFFTGDVAEVVFYARSLGEAEMTQLSESLAAKYAFRLLDKAAHGTAESTGFSATGISVAEGAALRLPLNATAPVTLGAGGTLAVAGTLSGSVRLGAGAVYDAAATTGEIEDLQLAGATFLASKASVVTIGTKLSGTAKLVLNGEWADGTAPARYVFATFDDYDDVKDVTWTSDEPGFKGVTVDRANKRLVARFHNGLAIIIR